MKTITGLLFVFLVSATGRAQRVEIYTDERGNAYTAINTEGIPRRVENRSENPDFYVDVPLYTYTETGEGSQPVVDAEGNQVYVKRVRRHDAAVMINGVGSVNLNMSAYFIISPQNVYSDGTTNATAGGKSYMDWATANGYLATANTTTPSVDNSATNTGCAMYRGKDGQDAPGTWRVPTQREGLLIMIFGDELNATSAQSGLVPFGYNGYWISTETNSFATNAWWLNFQSSDFYTSTKKSTRYLRCVRDIPVP